MINKEITKYALDRLIHRNSDKAAVNLTENTKHEINIESGELSLLRTTLNTDLNLIYLRDNRKGSITINDISKESINRAVEDVVEIAETSKADKANDIAPYQKPEIFTFGKESSDLEKMYAKIDSFIKTVKKRYPDIILSDSRIYFTLNKSHYLNSNGVDFIIKNGDYTFVPFFHAKKGNRVSSFNYSVFTALDIEKELIDCGSIDTLLSNSVEQLNAKTVDKKFIGDVIITPDCLYQFIRTIFAPIFEYSLLKGTSIYKNDLNKEIASSKFTLKSLVNSAILDIRKFITDDGYKSENMTIIDKGVLKTFLLSLYGANKTGFERSKNDGNIYVIDPGDKEINKIIESVDEGILLGRFSGGYPSVNGDFSGVAKNSFYIEKGKISYPINETMISGNTAEMLRNIKEISKERINFGFTIMPWICFEGITISGRSVKTEN